MVAKCQAQLTASCGVQFAFNTLSRVSPVSHGVCNVVRLFSTSLPSSASFGLRWGWKLSEQP